MNAPKRFTKKPVEVEALQWTGDNIEAVERFVGSHNVSDDIGHPVPLQIWNRLEAQWIRCPPDHWIIKGIKGEFYPCESEVFAATYEEAQAAASVS